MDERAFLQMLLGDPASTPATWLVLADWLEERGDPRAELIRLRHDADFRPDLRGGDRDARVRHLLVQGVRPCVPMKIGPASIPLVLIPPGKFLMGSPPDDELAEANETPQHEVEITRSFFIGAHPVTVAQFRAFVEQSGYGTEAEAGGLPVYRWANEEWIRDDQANWRNPGFPQQDDAPVTCVNWNDARRFCWWLHTCDRAFLYRLPSEAEWEYACRGGAALPARFFFGAGFSADLGNCDGSSPCAAPPGPFLAQTTPVGSYPPNAFGLYDLHGNVLEFCHDPFEPDYYGRSPVQDPPGPLNGIDWVIWYDQNFLGREQVEPSRVQEEARVLRGGNWLSDARYCRSAYRTSLPPTAIASTLGFRVVAIPRPAFALAPPS